MHAITTTKIIAGLMILCMLLTSVGCYTLDTVDVKDADADKDLIVRTKDRRYFWLATWKADSLGNVTGGGYECRSLENAKDLHNHRPYKATTPPQSFVGTIPASTIDVLQADKPNTVGTLGLVLGVAAIASIVWFLIFMNETEEVLERNLQ